jgi:ribose-phosphate pyrophosphokinase
MGAGGSAAAIHFFADSEAPAYRLAELLGTPAAPVEVHVFPDGERRVRAGEASSDVILYRSLNDVAARDPDDKLIEVLLAASALRDRGAVRITLVAPYLSYMRQDVAFRPGEAVSQKVVGDLLGRAFDRVIAVDPHLHRTRDLDAVFGPGGNLALSAAPAFVELLRAERVAPETLVIGPDAESLAQVRRLAEPLALQYLTAEKRRSGDREVEVVFPADAPLQGRPVILYDDMVSTGATLSRCAVLALQHGARSVEALAVHALYGPGEAAAFEAAGIRRLRSSDSLAHPSNAVFLAPLLAEALRG